MNNHRGNTTEPNSGVAQTRQHLQIMVGEQVQKDGTVYRISQVLDFETVIGIAVESGRSRPLRIKELAPLNSGSVLPDQDISEIGDADWQEAEHRFSIIKPLVDRRTVGRDAAEERAKQTGVDTATIYRWLKRYKATGSVLASIPQKPGWKKGKSRIPAHAEAVIQEVIKEVYLTLQRPSAQKAVQEVMRRCHERRIDPPSPGTVRARLRDIPERDRLRGHGFRDKAINKFQPAAGKFPNADYPLAVMQIDHTPADIILVDDVYRKPIGRPVVVKCFWPPSFEHSSSSFLPSSAAGCRRRRRSWTPGGPGRPRPAHELGVRLRRVAQRVHLHAVQIVVLRQLTRARRKADKNVERGRLSLLVSVMTRLFRLVWPLMSRSTARNLLRTNVSRARDTSVGVVGGCGRSSRRSRWRGRRARRRTWSCCCPSWP